MRCRSGGCQSGTEGRSAHQFQHTFEVVSHHRQTYLDASSFANRKYLLRYPHYDGPVHRKFVELPVQCNDSIRRLRPVDWLPDGAAARANAKGTRFGTADSCRRGTVAGWAERAGNTISTRFIHRVFRHHGWQPGRAG